MIGLSWYEQYYPLNPFEEPSQNYQDALLHNLASITYQQEGLPCDMPNDQNQTPANDNHMHVELSGIERTLITQKKRGNCRKDKRKKCNKKQSAKHNFPTFLIRQTKRLLRVYLQEINIQRLEDKYLQFVLNNIKKSRSSLKSFIISDQPIHPRQFEPFLREQLISEIDRVQQLRICRQYFSNFVLKNKDKMIEMAGKGEIEQQERTFVDYIERFLHDLEKERVNNQMKKEVDVSGIERWDLLQLYWFYMGCFKQILKLTIRPLQFQNIS